MSIREQMCANDGGKVDGPIRVQPAEIEHSLQLEQRDGRVLLPAIMKRNAPIRQSMNIFAFTYTRTDYICIYAY